MERKGANGFGAMKATQQQQSQEAGRQCPSPINRHMRHMCTRLLDGDRGGLAVGVGTEAQLRALKLHGARLDGQTESGRREQGAQRDAGASL